MSFFIPSSIHRSYFYLVTVVGIDCRRQWYELHSFTMKSKTTLLVALVICICFSLVLLPVKLSRLETASKSLLQQLQLHGDAPYVLSERAIIQPKTIALEVGVSSNQISCQKGTAARTVDLKALFPESIPVPKKGLLAMPVGGKNAIYVDQMVNATIQYFDILLFSFNNYDWSHYSWYPNVTLIQTPGGRKWKLAKDQLIPTVVNVHYSHVCFWDDDLAPTTLFDAGLFLYILQQQNMTIAQPTIRKNCHGQFAGVCSNDTNHNSHFQSVNLVEIMAPCYARDTWINYLWPNILDEEDGSGYGIDFTLHSNPSSESIYAIHLPLDHMDTKLLKNKVNRQQGFQYAQVRKRLNWTKTHLHGQSQHQARNMFQIQHYAIHVTNNCLLHSVPTGNSSNLLYFKSGTHSNVRRKPQSNVP